MYYINVWNRGEFIGSLFHEYASKDALIRAINDKFGVSWTNYSMFDFPDD